MNSPEVDQLFVIDELRNVVEKLKVEEAISPVFALVTMTYYGVANIIAFYKKQEKEVPPELVNFLTKTYPLIMSDHKDLIQTQYLTMNTEGEC